MSEPTAPLTDMMMGLTETEEEETGPLTLLQSCATNATVKTVGREAVSPWVGRGSNSQSRRVGVVKPRETRRQQQQQHAARV